jgi:hypothetical protein
MGKIVWKWRYFVALLLFPPHFCCASPIHSNHFRQSYMMQFHKVMYPVFARMGVKLITRNMAQGGLGTIQAGLGSGSIYGDEIDLLLWDSGKSTKTFGYNYM